MVTMSGPLWTIFSTSRRILRRSMSRFFSTLAATPEPSLTRPRRMCSVPMYSWLKRCASWLASCITLRARSVNRSYIGQSLSAIVGPFPVWVEGEPVDQQTADRGCLGWGGLMDWIGHLRAPEPTVGLLGAVGPHER